MSTPRITSTMKENIMVIVKKVVKESYSKSGLGIEVGEVCSFVYDMYKRIIDERYPQDDINILRKYGLCENTHRVFIIKSKEGLIKFVSYANNGYEINFPRKMIEYPESHSDMVDELNKEVSQENMEYIFNLLDKYNCEIMDIVSGYKRILSSHSTIKTLLEKHPNFVKYLPPHMYPEKLKSEYVNKPDYTKIVEQFEKMETEEVK